MKDNTSLFKTIIILVWFFGIALVTLVHPFTLPVLLTAAILYILLYKGITDNLFKTDRALITLAAFTTTFTGFWVEILHLIMYWNGLETDTNFISLVIGSVLYAWFFVLFYRTMPPDEKKSHDKQSTKGLQMFLEITFPIISGIFIFITTLFLYTVSFEEKAGIIMIVTTLAVTTIMTVLSVALFEQWLKTANNPAQIRVAILVTSVGILLTILLAWSSLQ